MYCDPVQVIDIYLRLVRRVLAGSATGPEQQLASALMDIGEIEGGLY